jgi:hypothetical protein
MRSEGALRVGRACGVLVALCLLVVTGRSRGWAQGDEPGQKQPEQSQPQAGGTPESGQAGASGQTPAQETPDAPGETKKDENPNPVQQAVNMTKDAATAGLLKARDWESGWIAGIYVGKNRKLVTLTAAERREIYLRQTLTTPEAYIKRMFAAGVDQVRGVPYQWDDGWAGYAERFASREGQFIAANSLAALGNAKLGYEVRYDQCKCEGLWRRTRHAFIRNLVTYDRSEEHLRPQLALYVGAFGGGMISTAWKPSPKNAFTNGGRAAAEQVGWGTLLNFFIEFSREINRKQGVK